MPAPGRRSTAPALQPTSARRTPRTRSFPSRHRRPPLPPLRNRRRLGVGDKDVVHGISSRRSALTHHSPSLAVRTCLRRAVRPPTVPILRPCGWTSCSAPSGDFGQAHRMGDVNWFSRGSLLRDCFIYRTTRRPNRSSRRATRQSSPACGTRWPNCRRIVTGRTRWRPNPRPSKD